MINWKQGRPVCNTSNFYISLADQNLIEENSNSHQLAVDISQENKNIKNVNRCRDGMPKSMQTR